MKEDAILFYGLSFCSAAVMEMEDVETPEMVVVTTYGSSSFYFAAAMETVTESAVSNHNHPKRLPDWQPFSPFLMFRGLWYSVFFSVLRFFFLPLNRKFTFQRNLSFPDTFLIYLINTRFINNYHISTPFLHISDFVKSFTFHTNFFLFIICAHFFTGTLWCPSHKAILLLID